MSSRIGEDDDSLLRAHCPASLDQLEALMQQVDAAGRRAGAEGDCLHDLRLVVEEACVNVMRHAYAGQAQPGELSLSMHADRLDGRPAVRVELCDRGRAFNPLEAAEPGLDTPAEERPIGGLGIHLIRNLTERQHYTRDDRHGNRLVLHKVLAA